MLYVGIADNFNTIVNSAPVDAGYSLGELLHVESRDLSTKGDFFIIGNFYLNAAELGIPGFGQS